MNKITQTIVAILVSILAVTVAVDAKSYALLVGINHYQNVQKLGGAVSDAEELGKLLKKQGVNTIKVLLDEQASKQSILSELSRIAHTIKKDDTFYMFFSGHGTSLEDKSSQSLFQKETKLLTLLENSGALLPYDFDTQHAARSLIIGSRDLRPLFQEIDGKGVRSLVVFDACFSGKTFRGIPAKRKRRRHYTPPSHPIEFTVKKSHPYKSLVYVASTSASDWAVEDQSTNRGYLMEQLEKCLKGSADSDEDREITKQELKYCIDNSNLPQAPQVYPEEAEINPVIFKVYKPKKREEPGPTITPHLTVTVEGNRYRVSDQFGEIASFAREDQVARYREAYKIIALQGAKNFSLYALSPQGVKQKMCRVGDALDVTIESSRGGYLVLFDLDAQGNLFMIEPYPDHVTEIPANRSLSYTRLSISEPVGTELMKGFVISDPAVIRQLQKLSPTNDKGLVTDPKALYGLLSRLPRSSYDTALLKLSTFKK
ncbi:MAG TPA: hypothetical protein ENL02_03265 [Epsilonproteobacteria bacterium]|nr:hypothetical protein [Campylobacterota bacterium]